MIPLVKFVQRATKIVVKKAVQHSPEILVAMGIAGMGGCIALAVKCEDKRREAIIDKEMENDVCELDKKEKIIITAKSYAPVIGLFTLSAGCIIFSNRIGAKRLAIISTAYKATETAYLEYKNLTKPLIDETKHAEIEKEVKEKVMHAKEIPQNIVPEEDEDVWFYDTLSGREFKSSKEKIRQAINSIVSSMMFDGDTTATVNDFYWEMSNLKLPPVEVWDDYEWDINSLPGRRLEPIFTAYAFDENRTGWSFEFSTKPKLSRKRR
ncbi:MAG: hypothetical protein KBT27_09395 [Prevotellaceae bacterium]|nr:hypothetical protein [Candidatus Faecinaster equi]